MQIWRPSGRNVRQGHIGTTMVSPANSGPYGDRTHCLNTTLVCPQKVGLGQAFALVLCPVPAAVRRGQSQWHELLL